VQRASFHLLRERDTVRHPVGSHWYAGGIVSDKKIKVLALQSPQIIINALTRDFEHRTGYQIEHLLHPGDMPVHITQKLDAGERFDVAFVIPAVLDQLIAAGRAVAGTRTNFLRVPIGVAVHLGSPKPDISTVEAFKRTLRDVKSIAYLRAGISGPHLDSLFETWGMAKELQLKSKRTETDTVGELVAQGDAEIGVTAIATLIATPGLEIVGPIPKEIQSYVSFQGAVSTNAVVPEVARELIRFVTGPNAAQIIKAKGMEPWEQ
jgi:molybdate transport system substrate-binding protein